MTLIRKKTVVRAALLGLGIAAIGSTAAPLIDIWQHQAAESTLSSTAPIDISGRMDQPDTIVVDVKDNASAADVAEIEGRVGVPLHDNSPESHDKLMLAVLPTRADAAGVLASLHSDPNVEAAEEEMLYSLPERSPMSGDAMQAIGIVRAQVEQVAEAKAQANEAAQAAGFGPNPGADQATDGAHWAYPQTQSPYQITENGRTLAIAQDGQWVFNAYHDASDATNGLAPVRGLNNGTRPNDPLYDSQWNFQMVGAEDAWKKTRGKGVIVAVIDTGVAAKTTKKGKQCKDFVTTSFTPGYDFVNKDADPYDDNGHGTHVAGTIAESTNNNEGAAGLAYEATIMPLKVPSGAGSGYSSDIADAIRYAADHGANVINMSLGSSRPSDVIHKACQYAYKKGVTIVCAAGNGFGEPVGYPAAFPECVAISSVGPSRKIATYSSYGKEVALAAPGGDMMESGDPKDGILQNTVLSDKNRGRGDDYYAFQGTSMASPHAAAVAALIESVGVKDPARVRDVLTRTAVPNGEPIKYGAGILSASGAVAMAAAESGFKLRHLLLLGFGFLLLAVGPRRSVKTRLGMFAALGIGFFGPDWAANCFGANSPWNLVTFSALLPLAAYLTARDRASAVKVAGAFALGIAVNLWAGWYNALTPFTADIFGNAGNGWTLTNMAVAFGLANIAGLRALSMTGGATAKPTK